MTIAYNVTATFRDEATRDEYISWLENGHIDAVIAGGAHAAAIVRLDRSSPDDPIRVEVRYVFATRELFERYLADFAPTLRADGLKRFPPERGVSLARSIGEIL